MVKPLFDAVVNMNKKLKARFFMPSHAGRGEGILSASCWDMTEIEGLDNLLQANGVILQSERLMAAAYKCRQSLMLTQGSTCANHIAIGIASCYGKKLLVLGDCHKSVFCGCQLFGMTLQVLDNLNNAEINFATNSDLAGIIITTPNYFGQVVDLTKIRNVCDRFSKLLIVDAAHGAHFGFSRFLPQNSSSIADLTSISMHKTMNVYGGGAILNINKEGLYEQALYYRNILHSTSPNYLTMASMDNARADFEENGEKYYSEILDSVNKFKNFVKEKLSGQVKIVLSDDFTRLVIDLNGCDGHDLLLQLLNVGIGLEMAYFDKIIAIVNPFNFKQLGLLADALYHSNFKTMSFDMPNWKGKKSNISIGKIKFVEIDMALGEVSANDIGIYPPGSPIIHRGDILDDKAIKIIKDYKENIFGLVNSKICVLY